MTQKPLHHARVANVPHFAKKAGNDHDGDLDRVAHARRYHIHTLTCYDNISYPQTRIHSRIPTFRDGNTWRYPTPRVSSTVRSLYLPRKGFLMSHQFVRLVNDVLISQSGDIFAYQEGLQSWRDLNDKEKTTLLEHILLKLKEQD